MPPPAQNAPRRLVIDLTESDSEDAPTRFLPFSNDGLPTSSSVGGQKLQRGGSSLGQNYTDRIIPSVYTGGSRTASLADRRSLKSPPYNHARRVLDNTEHNVGHVAKRRKVSEGPGAFVANEVDDSRLPRNGDGRSLRVKSESTSSRSAPKLPEIITGEMRAGNSSQSKATHKNLSRSRIAPEAEPDTVNLMLHKQVFPYLKAALRPFSDTISQRTREEIGNKVGKILIDDPRFIQELATNNHVLSVDYEIQLSRKAQTLVTQYAHAFLNGKAIEPHQAPSRSQSTFKSGSVKPPQKVAFPATPLLLNPGDRVSTESESSSDQDEIFELRPDVPVQVRSSFSPSTPLSNDLSELPMMLKSIEPTVGNTRPERSTRALKPTYIPKRRARRWHKRPADDRDSSSAATPAAEHIPDRTRTLLATDIDKNQATNVTLRPYLTCSEREALISDLKRRSASGISSKGDDLATRHIPFSENEAGMLVAFLYQKVLKVSMSKGIHSDAFRQIIHLMSSRKADAGKLASRIAYDNHGLATAQTLRGRDRSSIIAFFKDAASDEIHEHTSFSLLQPTQAPNSNFHLSNLLRQRETYGLEPLRVRKGGTSYRQEISSFMEDLIVPQSEWTDCSGDIASLAWTSDEAFIIGALAHFDPHNMQYNKPGNLLVGSIVKDSLRAYPDHKIARPLISELQNRENALDSMRQTQDPWLYASVVCAAHSSVSGYTFTSSYDRTVKTWKVSKDGSSMELCGTWEHQARVNFVATSEHHNRVATASETYKDAVRIYDFDKEAISESAYDEYGGNKSQEQADVQTRQRWAYQPATMKWARAAKVAHLLLVGYSPRSETGDDSDIPDDKKNTGELCVWDYVDGSRYNVSSSRTSNIFEAVWHPTQQMFAAATSPSGNFESDRTKTQVRLFALNERIFTMIIALDCPALDINELTIMPNSTLKCYVTASCTDGNTYVWDTAQGEDPIHVLGHGDSLDNPDPDIPLELADGGVTFASWGATVDRFYTGATDGKLKSWDIRRPPGYALVRNVLELSGGISSGAFSKDFRKLLIGDGTGKVHLLGVDDTELSDNKEATSRSMLHPRDVLSTSGILPTSIKRPKVIIPHPEPAPPESSLEIIGDSKGRGQDIGQKYLKEGLLEIHEIHKIKSVFQGPNYHELSLYRFEAHEEMDGTKPLLPDILASQQFLQDEDTDLNMWDLNILSKPKPAGAKEHKKNEDLDFAFHKLSLETQAALERDAVELDWDMTGSFDYEISPSRRIFRLGKASARRSES